MKRRLRSIPIIVSSLACLASLDALAVPAKATIKLDAFNLNPHVYLWGETGSYTAGKGQLLLPIYGDQSKAFFAIAEGNAVHDRSWLAGVGLGYRLVQDERIYGGYLIADYNVSRDSNNFKILSPGLEVLGKVWDLHLNGYIPLSSSKKEFVQEGFYKDLTGKADYIVARDWSEFDAWARKNNVEAAARGFDFKVGRVIPYLEKGKIYVGGYHFWTSEIGNINGVSAKLSYTLNKYAALELTDTYDNYNHNRAMLGIKVTLGGYSASEKREFGISSRLLDSIEHGYGSTVVPIKRQVNIGIINREQLRYDNVWHVDPNAAPGGDGSAQRPYKEFNKQTFSQIYNRRGIGTITKCPMLYFAPGTYSFADFSSTAGSSRGGRDSLSYAFVLPQGWGMYGKTNGFTIDAVNDQRALFIGTLALIGDAELGGGDNVISSIRFEAQRGVPNTLPGLYLQYVGNVLLSNVKVGNESIAVDTGNYYSGVSMYGSQINLYGVDIYGFANNGTSYGIYADGSEINILGGKNNISATSNIDTPEVVGIASAISVNKSTVNFNGGCNKLNSTAYINITGAGAKNKLSDGLFSNIGINAYSSTINFNDGINDIFAITKNNSSDYAGIGVVTNGIAAFFDSAINFNGEINTVKAESYNNSSSPSSEEVKNVSAVSLWQSTLNLMSGVNYLSALGYANNNVGLVVYGIDARALSTVNFLGGINNVKMVKDAVASDGLNDDYALSGVVSASYQTTVNFKGGVNCLSATTSALVNAVRGVYAELESNVNFSGGITNINVLADNSNSGFLGQVAIGVEAVDYSTVSFSGGRNSLNVWARGSQLQPAFSQVFGVIAADAAVLDFAGGVNSINLGAHSNASMGRSAYGIFTVGSNTKLMKDGVEVGAGSLGALLDRVTLVRAAGEYSFGSMILRSGIDSLNW